MTTEKLTPTAVPAEQDLLIGHLPFLADQVAPYFTRVEKFHATIDTGYTPAQQKLALDHTMQRCLLEMIAALREPGAASAAESAARTKWAGVTGCRLATVTGVIPTDAERDALMLMAAIRVLAQPKPITP